MENKDKVEIVQQIQNYIKENSRDDGFCVEKICREVGYSRRQIDRLFKGFLGKTLHEYINAVCLTQSAKREEDFCIAIEKAYEALGKYDFRKYGYELAYDAAPTFNMGADPVKGARIAVPVREI